MLGNTDCDIIKYNVCMLGNTDCDIIKYNVCLKCKGYVVLISVHIYSHTLTYLT